MLDFPELTGLSSDEQIAWIPGYEGHYMIASGGRVWRCGREVESVNRWGPFIKYLKAKWLKPGVDGRGYNHVVLWKDGEHKNMKIHRLVSEAFIPNPSNLPEINHIDGNKQNNHSSNLEWVTHQQNINHSVENRLHYPNRSSEYHGVCWHKASKKWYVRIRIKGKLYNIGLFDNEVDAAKAWDSYLKSHNITNRLYNFSAERSKESLLTSF